MPLVLWTSGNIVISVYQSIIIKNFPICGQLAMLNSLQFPLVSLVLQIAFYFFVERLEKLFVYC